LQSQIALIVACRAALSIVRSICARRATATTDNAANRGEECVLETERSENISARHYEKAGEPSSSELFSSGASKPTRPQIIKCIEDAELEASHR
jgi:hypothetical protein